MFSPQPTQQLPTADARPAGRIVRAFRKLGAGFLKRSGLHHMIYSCGKKRRQCIQRKLHANVEDIRIQGGRRLRMPPGKGFSRCLKDLKRSHDSLAIPGMNSGGVFRVNKPKPLMQFLRPAPRALVGKPSGDPGRYFGNGDHAVDKRADIKPCAADKQGEPALLLQASHSGQSHAPADNASRVGRKPYKRWGQAACCCTDGCAVITGKAV